MGLLLTILVVAVVGLLAWRGARTRLEEIGRARPRKGRRDATVTLEKDPRTGVYRTPDDDER